MRELAGKDAEVLGRLRKRVAEARKATHEHVYNRIIAHSRRGLRRILNQLPLLYHVDKSIVNERTIASFFKQYRETLPEERRMLFDRYKVADIALKVVEVGSVGTRCFVVLLLAAPDDPLFLQIKEARPSVLEHYTGHKPVRHNGPRVVVGQRLMQAASDIFLGWSRGPKGRDFYVRQLRDMKLSPRRRDTDSAGDGIVRQALRSRASLCA